MESVKEIGVTPGKKKSLKKQALSGHLPETIFLAHAGWYRLYGKRFFDLLVTVTLLVSLFWIAPFLYLLVKLTSKGPFLFAQKRVGRYGHIFKCYKIRTMHPNLASDTLQASGNDLRITWAGKLLRRSHLDELPQLFNVLNGDMSLIGPRPHMISDDLVFMEMVPGYADRRLVLPGLTGLAQIKGYRGPTPDYFSISGRSRFDAFYARNVSLRIDLRIALATLFIHFSGK